MSKKSQTEQRALNLAGVPDYSEVNSSSSDSPSHSPSACHFCGQSEGGVSRCKSCQQGVYCSSLCLAEHHLPFCARKR